MIEGTGWTREADHTGILKDDFNKFINLRLILFLAPQFNSAIAFAFIGEYSNMDPDQIAIDAFLNFLQIAETDEGHNNLLPEEYILIAQRDLINTQNPGNALYALLKTWNNWSIDWEFYF